MWMLMNLGGPGCGEALSAGDVCSGSLALIAADGALCRIHGLRGVACQVHDLGEVERSIALRPRGI
jgi:hypothetical protein